MRALVLLMTLLVVLVPLRVSGDMPVAGPCLHGASMAMQDNGPADTGLDCHSHCECCFPLPLIAAHAVSLTLPSLEVPRTTASDVWSSVALPVPQRPPISRRA